MPSGEGALRTRAVVLPFCGTVLRLSYTPRISRRIIHDKRLLQSRLLACLGPQTIGLQLATFPDMFDMFDSNERRTS
jgi:hypothetical protein